jgi:hypothetical protein
MREGPRRGVLVGGEVAALEAGFHERGNLPLVGDFVGVERKVVEQCRLEQPVEEHARDDRRCGDNHGAERDP